MSVKLSFYCVENACRSQMAEGFAKQLTSEEVDVSSGGSKPAEQVNEKAVKVMAEKGIDISSQTPTSFTPKGSKKIDYAVTMGCSSNACPTPISNEIIEWDIDDPSGKSIEKFRETRDKIEKKVKDLVNELDLS